MRRGGGGGGVLFSLFNGGGGVYEQFQVVLYEQLVYFVHDSQMTSPSFFGILACSQSILHGYAFVGDCSISW